MKTLLVSLLITSATLIAADPVRDHDVTLEDYFTQAYITSAVISPDGQYVAYTDQRWEPPAETRNVDLWVVNTKTAATRRLTFGREADSGPQWGADSRWIYFTSSRGEEKGDPPFNRKKQVWRISVEGGEPQVVTRLPRGLDTYAISADGGTLYYLTSDEAVDDEWKDLREKHGDVEYGHGVENYSQLWALDLATWRAEKILDPKRYIGQFSVAPQGNRIALVTVPTDRLIANEGWSRIDIYDAATRTTTALRDSLWRQAAPSPYGWVESPAWNSDGSRLAFHVDYDGYPAQLFAAEIGSRDTVVWEIPRPEEVSVGGQLAWLGNNDLCFVAEQRAYSRIFCVRGIGGGRQGTHAVFTPGQVSVNAFTITPNGKNMAVLLITPTHNPEIYLGTPGARADLRRLTNSNPQMDTWKLPQITTVTWKSRDGQEVEGVLELPPDYKPGTRLPMHVVLHGGPTMSDHATFKYWIYGRTLFSTQGWAVLSPNYRGSTGYGDRFLTDLIGRENDIEVQDILTGVDAMIERGIADPGRLAVSGWSNGGYLTNAVITHTQRFKAASSGAGVIDMGIQWGIEDTPGHVINYMEGLPWERADEYRESSPLWNLDKVTTPTLIHVGQGDERVPAAHGIALHRALKHYLDVPTELIMYPGEGHGLTKYKHRRAKLEWDLAWFEKYVLKKTVAEPEKPVQ